MGHELSSEGENSEGGKQEAAHLISTLCITHTADQAHLVLEKTLEKSWKSWKRHWFPQPGIKCILQSPAPDW
jgi:hypothetical protein